MRPTASLAYRLAVFFSLGILAAGCSTTGTSNVATVPSSISTQAAARGNALAERQVADGLVKPPARAPKTRHGWISPDILRRKPALIYWGNYGSSTIDIFSARGINPPLKGTITTGVSNPERLFVDAALNVYSTNIGYDSTGNITAYKRGATSPFLTISNGINRPTGITVDAAGTVYAANFGNDTITEYPKGQKSPSLTINMGSTAPEYLAIDSADNLYVSTLGNGVWEFAKGSTTGKNLGLSVVYPDGVEVDKNGNIIVIDSSAGTIDVFPPGKTTPSKTVAVTAGSPFALSLNKAETTLFVTVTSGSGFIVQSLAYPNGTTLANKITANDGQWPIAVSPDAVL